MEPALRREPLVEGLRAMGPALRDIAAHGVDLGLSPPLLAHLRPGVLAQAEAVEKLS
jgi:hypothetical protein